MSGRFRTFAVSALAVTLTTGLVGCGDDDSTETAATDTSAVSGSVGSTTTTTSAATPTKVPVGLADYSFDIPATLTAGPTEFVATNSGSEEHHMTLVKLKDGQTLGDVIAVLSGDVAKGLEENQLVPGPQGVAPGGTQSIVLDLEAGGYVALCAIPSPDGLPHAAKGMVKEITVAPAATEAELSAVPDSPKVTLKDYSFELPSDFDGQGAFRVENAGNKPHEIVFYKIADGSTYEDAVSYMTATTPPAGPPPFTGAGGVTAFSPGQVAGMVLDLDPGTYVAVCFLPATDGKTHLQHGMIQEVEIS
ncbi:MAG: hypothetical protein IT195_11535 [Microthrixaceae bacterium]|nr:hypothetical protein [Microthrixaceae bacterium]